MRRLEQCILLHPACRDRSQSLISLVAVDHVVQQSLSSSLLLHRILASSRSSTIRSLRHVTWHTCSLALCGCKLCRACTVPQIYYFYRGLSIKPSRLGSPFSRWKTQSSNAVIFSTRSVGPLLLQDVFAGGTTVQASALTNRWYCHINSRCKTAADLPAAPLHSDVAAH